MVNKGQLKNEIVYSTSAKICPNAKSEIIKHYTNRGRHIATTHRIRDKNGKILNWDAKDFRLGDICYWRWA